MPAKNKKPAAKSKRKSNGTKTPGKTTQRKRMLRIDLMVKAQQNAVGRIGKFVEDASDMVMKGRLSPTDWLKRYADLWRDMAKDFADVTKRL